MSQADWEAAVLAGIGKGLKQKDPKKVVDALSPAQFKKLKLWGSSEKARRARPPGEAADRILHLHDEK